MSISTGRSEPVVETCYPDLTDRNLSLGQQGGNREIGRSRYCRSWSSRFATQANKLWAVGSGERRGRRGRTQGFPAERVVFECLRLACKGLQIRFDLQRSIDPLWKLLPVQEVGGIIPPSLLHGPADSAPASNIFLFSFLSCATMSSFQCDTGKTGLGERRFD